MSQTLTATTGISCNASFYLLELQHHSSHSGTCQLRWQELQYWSLSSNTASSHGTSQLPRWELQCGSFSGTMGRSLAPWTFGCHCRNKPWCQALSWGAAGAPTLLALTWVLKHHCGKVPQQQTVRAKICRLDDLTLWAKFGPGVWHPWFRRKYSKTGAQLVKNDIQRIVIYGSLSKWEDIPSRSHTGLSWSDCYLLFLLTAWMLREIVHL